MKKYRLLILSVLLLLVSFAAAWYEDHLFNHLFVYAIPIYLLLLACFIVLLVMSIWGIIKRKEYIHFFSIAVLALLVVLLVTFPFRDARVKWELNRFEADRLEIIEMIQSHQLQPDSLGNVVLPVGYKRLSSDGEAYVYQNDKNGQVICFWGQHFPSRPAAKERQSSPARDDYRVFSPRPSFWGWFWPDALGYTRVRGT